MIKSSKNTVSDYPCSPCKKQAGIRTKYNNLEHARINTITAELIKEKLHTIQNRLNEKRILRQETHKTAEQIETNKNKHFQS